MKKDINISKRVQSKDVYNCLVDNYSYFSSDWVYHQWNWLHQNYSAFNFLSKYARKYETLAEDVGHLSPWITWPSLHRGVSNEQHEISDFGMDLSNNKPCNSYTTGNVDCSNNLLPIMGEKKDCLTLKQDCEVTFIKLKMESFIDSIASALKKIENL